MPAMERIGDYIVCTICQRKFFTKTGFQIHINKDHCRNKSTLEAKRPAESSTRSNETESFDSIKRSTWSEPEEKEALNTEGISLKSTDKTATILIDRVLLELTDHSSRKTELLTNPNEITKCKTGSKKMLDAISNNTFHCEICQTGFKFENEWKRHLEIGHEKKRDYQCQNCDKMFTTMSILTRHKKTVHSKIRPFQCQNCDKMFASKQNLIIHKATVHDRIKKYHCQICKKNFFQSGHLLRHTKSVHEILKPYNCQTCDKSFASKLSLQLHTLTVHEMLKHFHCQTCDKSFAQKKTLQKHTLSVHEKVK